MQPSLQRIIWLASFPKSGNTWTRAFLGNYLATDGQRLSINELNSFTTGDVRQDFWDAAWGGRYEGQSVETGIKLRPEVMRRVAASKDRLHFVKTHTRIDKLFGVPLIPPDVTAAAIYIVRNPFDVTLSYSRHISAPIDETITRMSDPEAINASETQIFEIIGRWDHHVNSWETAPGLPLFFMRYEDMIFDTERTFRALLKYLQIPVLDGQLRRAVRRSSFKELQKQERLEGFRERPNQMKQFFHSGTSGGWRNALTTAQIDRVASEFESTLKRHYPEILKDLGSENISA